MGWTRAIKESIAHWEQMREYARQRPGNLQPDKEAMYKAIGKTWSGTYCALCQCRSIIPGASCEADCPLGRAYGPCTGLITPNAWLDVVHAKSWDEWLIHSDRMIYQLKSLIESPRDNAELKLPKRANDLMTETSWRESEEIEFRELKDNIIILGKTLLGGLIGALLVLLFTMPTCGAVTLVGVVDEASFWRFQAVVATTGWILGSIACFGRVIKKGE